MKAFYNKVMITEGNIFEACTITWIPFRGAFLDGLSDAAFRYCLQRTYGFSDPARGNLLGGEHCASCDEWRSQSGLDRQGDQGDSKSENHHKLVHTMNLIREQMSVGWMYWQTSWSRWSVRWLIKTLILFLGWLCSSVLRKVFKPRLRRGLKLL